MAKELKLVFLDEKGKKKILTPKGARENLETETVKEVMEGITQLSIFEVNQVKKYVTPDSAHYTETIITPVYQKEAE